MIRRAPRTAAVVLIFPVYLLYFSLQKAFIVRNLLSGDPVPGPPGRAGSAGSSGRISSPSAQGPGGPGHRRGASGQCGIPGSCRRVDPLPGSGSHRAAGPWNTSARDLVFASRSAPGVRGRLETVTNRLPDNVVTDLADADRAIILASEAYRLLPWPQGDRPETTLGWFGPREVNLKYYIS